MNTIEEKALRYHQSVASIGIPKTNDTLRWVSRYNISHPGRRHLFQIAKDIMSLPQCRVIEQGAAEGIICKILQDEGYNVFAVDNEPFFKKCWKRLGVKGVIGDCSDVDWWNGRRYDVIIAGVWVACKGSKSKRLTAERRKELIKIRDNWFQILSPAGIVYFDVNTSKYPLRPLMQVFGEKFEASVFKKKPRLLIKCIKHEGSTDI